MCKSKNVKNVCTIFLFPYLNKFLFYFLPLLNFLWQREVTWMKGGKRGAQARGSGWRASVRPGSEVCHRVKLLQTAYPAFTVCSIVWHSEVTVSRVSLLPVGRWSVTPLRITQWLIRFPFYFIWYFPSLKLFPQIIENPILQILLSSSFLHSHIYIYIYIFTHIPFIYIFCFLFPIPYIIQLLRIK